MTTITGTEWAVDWDGDGIEGARDRDDAHRGLRMGSIGGGESWLTLSRSSRYRRRPEALVGRLDR